MPPRRRVATAISQAPGSAKRAYQPSAFGMWLREWCASSCASTTRTSSSPINGSSSSVFQKTIRFVGPKPTAYAFGEP